MSNNISATELAGFNTESDESFAENYIESLDCVTVFRDEIKKNLPAAGFTGIQTTLPILSILSANVARKPFQMFSTIQTTKAVL